jgi:hypothetical protein
MAKVGRPKKEINYNLVDSLCEIQCTGEEIAAVLDIDYDTLNAALKRDKGVGFSDYFSQKRNVGKKSLRRRQWQAAIDDGNTTMLIWLGKQFLGQSDKQELTGKDGEPIKVTWQK